jgi:uncharacterized membrane protein YhaH (DUF805 family)/Tfp pilus assembly major pilin PilA
MQNRNPYAAPQANVSRADSIDDYGEVKIFSARGRIGRMRYIGYTIGVTVLFGILINIAAGLVGLAGPNAALLAITVGYVGIVVVQVLLKIQRSHDMNVTGWLSLIMLIPLAALVFWFVPGTRGENNYGKQPPPNGMGVIILGCVLPIAFVGMMAGIAVPAYQDYTIRAQVSEGLNLAAAAKAAVGETYFRTREAAVDRGAAGMSPAATDTRGKYVESVDVAGGTILITYGGEANSTIAGRILGLQPYVTSGTALVWRCGAGRVPQDAVAIDAGAPSAAGSTDIDTRHLPSACRP